MPSEIPPVVSAVSTAVTTEVPKIEAAAVAEAAAVSAAVTAEVPKIEAAAVAEAGAIAAQLPGRWARLVRWLKAHPWVWVAIAFALGLALGHTIHPAVRVEARTETKTETKVEYKDRVVEKVVTVQGETRTEIRYVDRVISAACDGGVRTTTEHETDVIGDRTDTRTADARAEDRSGTADTTVHTTAVRVEVPAAPPQWRVAVLAGASLRAPLLPVYGPLTLGVEVDRRLLGPVSLGVWASTQGAAGAALAVDF
jgi:hypothetical protein